MVHSVSRGDWFCSNGRERSVVPTPKHYRQIVRRFDEIVRPTLGALPRIPDICETLAVSQRTLGRAVRAVHGTTPSHYLRALALAEVRKALLDGRNSNVRQVALRFGFRELGRFAAEYRAAFGENPSQTLRKSWAKAADEPDRSADSYS